MHTTRQPRTRPRLSAQRKATKAAAPKQQFQPPSSKIPGDSLCSWKRIGVMVAEVGGSVTIVGLTRRCLTGPAAQARRCFACDNRIRFMTKKAISAGAVHDMPADLRKVLISDPAARAKWEDITPLARNEWICWVISVKKPETRRQHIERVRTELKEGMRRPCCWPGCPHR